MRSSALVLVLLLAGLPDSAASESVQAIQRIKAVFLFKFASFVEWPAGTFADAGAPIVICVVGAESIARELEQAVSGRVVGGRPLQARRMPRPDAVANCHILFIGRGMERDRAAELLAQVQGRPVLTITDHGGDSVEGSIINFLDIDDRVRFDINRDWAELNGLQLRSQLLAVARQVSPQ